MRFKNLTIFVVMAAAAIGIAGCSRDPKVVKQRYFEREGARVKFRSNSGEVSSLRSVLSQFKRPDDPTPISRLGREFDHIKRRFQLKQAGSL